MTLNQIPEAGQILRVRNYQGSVSDPIDGFRDDTGALVDPATIELRVLDPQGDESTYSTGSGLVKEAVGLYHVDLNTTGRAGDWAAAWSTSGPQMYKSTTFHVKAGPV